MACALAGKMQHIVKYTGVNTSKKPCDNATLLTGIQR